jgi:hypothetical protein
MFQMIYVAGDLHGGMSFYCITPRKFRPAKRGDIVLCCGDFGGVWYHDYHKNPHHRHIEDRFLEQTLRKRVLWLTVDGNHENFDRLIKLAICILLWQALFYFCVQICVQ